MSRLAYIYFCKVIDWRRQGRENYATYGGAMEYLSLRPIQLLPEQDSNLRPLAPIVKYVRVSPNENSITF